MALIPILVSEPFLYLFGVKMRFFASFYTSGFDIHGLVYSHIIGRFGLNDARRWWSAPGMEMVDEGVRMLGELRMPLLKVGGQQQSERDFGMTKVSLAHCLLLIVVD